MENILKQIKLNLGIDKLTAKNAKVGIIKNVCFSLYFFFALFQPPFVSIKTRYMIIAFNFMAFAFISVITGKIRVPVRVLVMLGAFVPFLAYFCFMQVRHALLDPAHQSTYIFLMKTLINVYLYFIILVLALVRICNFYKLSYHDVVKFLFNASLMQFVCVVTAFVIPAVKNRFLLLVTTYSDDEVIKKAIKHGEKYRCFGFAENLFDSFGYILAILISIILLEGIARKNSKYIAAAIAMLIMPLLNARTGIVLAFVGFAVIMLYYFSIKTALSTIITIPIVVYIASKLMVLLPSSTTKWIMKGFEETNALMNGDTSSGVYSEIFGKDLVFPESSLWGAGATPESITSYSGIDSGYIQCIWRFGIIGSALLFLAYINMFRTAFRATDSKQMKCICTVIMAIFFVYLFKLYSITNYGAIALVFGIPAIIIGCSENEKGGS